MTTELKRSLGPGLLIFYGVGVMVGAGIYVLVGEVAGESGVFAPLAFLLAGVIALPSALSYAELSTRYPEAAGEVAYVESAFGRNWLAMVAGLGIVVAGTVSAAAVLKGGAGYLMALLPVPSTTLVLITGAILIAIAAIGVVESLGFAAILTTIEVVGLLLVVWAGASAEAVVTTPPPMSLGLAGIGAGAALAFFAFIGFEDIVNLAEEAKRPERTLPIAIVASLAIATALYVLVSWAAVRSVGAEALSGSHQPLALVWETSGRSGAVLAAIAVAAAMNGVLAQIVMAARVLLGLGRRSGTFQALALVHPRFGTPVRATLAVGVVVLIAAVLFPVGDLARLTTIVLLAVFLLVNIALIRLKRGEPSAAFTVPVWVPYSGATLAGLALMASIGDLL